MMTMMRSSGLYKRSLPCDCDIEASAGRSLREGRGGKVDGWCAAGFESVALAT